jgi:hypothetical protein
MAKFLEKIKTFAGGISGASDIVTSTGKAIEQTGDTVIDIIKTARGGPTEDLEQAVLEQFQHLSEINAELHSQEIANPYQGRGAGLINFASRSWRPFLCWATTIILIVNLVLWTVCNFQGVTLDIFPLLTIVGPIAGVGYGVRTYEKKQGFSS